MATRRGNNPTSRRLLAERDRARMRQILAAVERGEVNEAAVAPEFRARVQAVRRGDPDPGPDKPINPHEARRARRP